MRTLDVFYQSWTKRWFRKKWTELLSCGMEALSIFYFQGKASKLHFDSLDTHSRRKCGRFPKEGSAPYSQFKGNHGFLRQHLVIREYRYAYGAVEPLTGESCFLVMPYCNTACMNLFLRELSKQFPQDTILMCCDGAAWHKSGTLEVPENIVLFHIPPYTPEMNPIEQIWKEIRKRGFRNEVFATLEKVVDRLCDTICSLTPNTIFSITGRDWIIKAFN